MERVKPQVRGPVQFGKPMRETYSATQERPPQLARLMDLARDLGVSTNQVWTWKTRRDRNGFPEPVACTWTPWRDGRFGGKDLYDLAEVRRWFRAYHETQKSGRTRRETARGRKPR